ncbi:NUDIX domain-containing protein [Paractinoplanes rhizophilus]|jgi:8-oxo-dGTP pyrophosphatase MutT (NUDIX family)|uniref:NUDIX domain-containing protein n=1 Tax=Paractinoplanes rhizophilus TaxID=1416877 RepID=A0ABW2HN04_9ACTN|nr:NUDIX hydrolase [Actinoplanes sp.]
MALLVAAGALFRDAGGRFMLVKPHYKPEWDIPGGMVEEGETPSEACAREVAEELGLTIAVGPALVIDWAPHPAQGDKLLFVFDGGLLTEADRSAIRFVDGEITEWAFVAPDNLDDYTVARLSRRLRAAVPGETRYLEHGVPCG